MTILSPRSTLGTTAFILPSDLNDDWTYMAGSGHYRTADLKAALGIDELGCGCEEADDNLKAAIKRAEDAEAEALEQAKLVRTWADRAEKAEAALTEIRDLIARSCVTGPTFHAIRDIAAEALGPKASLPTGPGSLIIVNDLPVEEGPVTLALHDDGHWYYLTGTSYYPAERIIRADWKPALVVEAVPTVSADA